MSDDEHNAKVRQIGECVAAIVMLKEQICGMYAGLEEKRRGQAEQITALVDAERRLRKFFGAVDPAAAGDPGAACRARRARCRRGRPGKPRRQGQAEFMRRAGSAVYPDGREW